MSIKPCLAALLAVFLAPMATAQTDPSKPVYALAATLSFHGWGHGPDAVPTGELRFKGWRATSPEPTLQGLSFRGFGEADDVGLADVLSFQGWKSPPPTQTLSVISFKGWGDPGDPPGALSLSFKGMGDELDACRRAPLPPAPVANATPVDWSASIRGLGVAAEPGAQHLFACPAKGDATYSVWGDGLYTHDSSICAAATHAGGVDAETGGVVLVTMAPGEEGYEGSTCNGVSTRGYGRWDSSFRIVAATPGAWPGTANRAFRTIGWATGLKDLDDAAGDGGVFRLRCPPQGVLGAAIWGSLIYTDDSAICVAAVHAGVIAGPRQGGAVRVAAAPGQGGYEAAESNGVSSSSYGAWGRSFRFLR